MVGWWPTAPLWCWLVSPLPRPGASSLSCCGTVWVVWLLLLLLLPRHVFLHPWASVFHYFTWFMFQCLLHAANHLKDEYFTAFQYQEMNCLGSLTYVSTWTQFSSDSSSTVFLSYFLFPVRISPHFPPHAWFLVSQYQLPLFSLSSLPIIATCSCWSHSMLCTYPMFLYKYHHFRWSAPAS